MVFGGKKSQGAFEYILLLGGILLIVVVSVIIMRTSVLNQANQQIGGNVNEWQDVTDATCYVSNYFLRTEAPVGANYGTDAPDVSFEKGTNGWMADDGSSFAQDCTTAADGRCSLRGFDVDWTRLRRTGASIYGTDAFGPILVGEYRYFSFYYKILPGKNACFLGYYGNYWTNYTVIASTSSGPCQSWPESFPGTRTISADGNWHFVKIDMSSLPSGSYTGVVFKSYGSSVWLDNYCARK